MKKYSFILGFAFFIGLVCFSLLIDFNKVKNDTPNKDNYVKSVAYTENKEKPIKTIVDLKGLNNAFVSIAKNVIPAVVSITTEMKIKIYSGDNSFDFLFNPFGKKDNKEFEQRYLGLGSGIIISSDGFIITNKHVIDKTDKRGIQLADKRTYESEVIGLDTDTDVALLKINAKDLPTVVLGNSDDVEVGEWVLAIGSPLSPDLSSTVTAGIVSGIGRKINMDRTNRYSIENFIQTDAVVNPGNSGGPLLNIDGEVIGINTAIISRSGYNQGYAFAIPINIVKKVLSDLKIYGKVARGYIGISIGDISDTDDMEAFGLDKPGGVIVQGFTLGDNAKKAGIQIGDVITEVDGKKVLRKNELQSMVASKNPGDKVKLTVMRDGERIYITVTLLGREEEKAESLANNIQNNENKPPNIGILIEEVSSIDYLSGKIKRKGVIVIDIEDDSQLFRKGLSKGDLIWKIGNIEITSISDFNNVLKKYKGQAVRFFVIRTVTDETFILSIRIPQ